MSQYYRHKETKDERVKYGEVSNGLILTQFTKEGHGLGNSHYKLFVTQEQFKTDWEEFEFSPRIDQSEKDHKMLVKIINEHLEEMDNYGLMFQNDLSIDEWRHCNGEYQIVSKILKADFNKYKKTNDFYHQEIRRSLSEDDESEYGYGLEDVVCQVKMIADSFKAVAGHFLAQQTKQ